MNKGVENHWDNRAINKYMPEGSASIPFKRMIFLDAGDGDTDIPYNEDADLSRRPFRRRLRRAAEQKDLDTIHDLIFR
jgi:hypothetical protein